ncbi:MAG: ATP-binding cassette domain-containing protein, partial [bacterium]|nr:ATP-binding cassette domain-containing protein [bacterium]
RICKQDTGTITFKGQEISGLKSHAISKIGIARTFQNIELFSGLTTLQNIMLGRHNHMRSGLFGSLIFTPGTRKIEIQARKDAEDVIDFLELEAVRNDVVGTLPYGTRKRIELGRALALNPDLLLLDEPATGLNSEETEEVAWWITEIRAGLGVTILLVEHDMRLVMDLSDRVCVLDSGRVIVTGKPKDVQQHPDVITAYLGSTAHAASG